MYRILNYISIISLSDKLLIKRFTFFIAVSMKSTASNCPAFWANSDVNLPIPAPSSKTDFPSYAGNSDSTYIVKKISNRKCTLTK